MEKLISLYNNQINNKEQEIENLKEQIRINKEKLNNIRNENELIKENNYNYKIYNQKYIENLLNGREKNNNSTNDCKNKEKYITTIEEDNLNYIKNDLLSKISSFYNNIFKLINKTNENRLFN